jgi:Zn-dependent oligopeptidase
MSKIKIQRNQVIDMAIHELAGTKVRKEDYIDLEAIARAYHNNHPDVTNPHQQVRFGHIWSSGTGRKQQLYR